MSITVLHQSATIGGLRDQGTPARALTQPPCRLRGIDVELAGAGGNSSGAGSASLAASSGNCPTRR